MVKKKKKGEQFMRKKHFITLIICVAIGLIKIVMLCIKECHEKKVLFDERDRKTKWEENRLKRDTALSGKESEIAFL